MKEDYSTKYPYDQAPKVQYPSEIYRHIARSLHAGLVLTGEDIDTALAESGYAPNGRLFRFDERIMQGRFRAATGVAVGVEKILDISGYIKLYFDWEFRRTKPREFEQSWNTALERGREQNNRRDTNR